MRFPFVMTHFYECKRITWLQEWSREFTFGNASLTISAMSIVIFIWHFSLVDHSFRNLLSCDQRSSKTEIQRQSLYISPWIQSLYTLFVSLCTLLYASDFILLCLGWSDYKKKTAAAFVHLLQMALKRYFVYPLRKNMANLIIIKMTFWKFFLLRTRILQQLIVKKEIFELEM